MFIDFIPYSILLLWLISQLIIFSFRVFYNNKFLKNIDSYSDIEINRHTKTLLLFIYANSFLWGISSAFAVLYGDSNYVYILIAAMLGVLTGTMATLTSIFHAVFFYMLNITIPFVFSLVFIGATQEYYLSALLLSIYLTVSIPAAFRVHISLRDNILQREKIMQLNDSLEIKVNKAIEQTKQKEKLLQEQTRLAQMGEMISMIAHQWRQPLGAISSSVLSIQIKQASGKFNLSKLEDRDEFLKFSDKKLNRINDYVQVLSNTIDDFRNFFKPDKEKELVTLSTPITRALQIVENSMSSKNITITTEFDNDDKVLMYQNEMMQVILNILKNAEDNFIEKNTKNPYIKIKTYSEDGAWVTSISDNGGGIPKDYNEPLK